MFFRYKHLNIYHNRFILIYLLLLCTVNILKTKNEKQHLNKKIGWASEPIDHNFVHSIYFYDPNGLALEITCRDKDYNEIMDKDKKVAHENLKQWTEKTRLKKESKVGSEKLDERALDKREFIKRLKISGLV